MKEVLQAAHKLGYASYERLILGVGDGQRGRFLCFCSVRGTSEEVAHRLLDRFPGLRAAFQMTEGGGTGIIIGTREQWKVIGPSSYRRGRVPCCLVAEVRSECPQEAAESEAANER